MYDTTYCRPPPYETVKPCEEEHGKYFVVPRRKFYSITKGMAFRIIVNTEYIVKRLGIVYIA